MKIKEFIESIIYLIALYLVFYYFFCIHFSLNEFNIELGA